MGYLVGVSASTGVGGVGVSIEGGFGVDGRVDVGAVDIHAAFLHSVEALGAVFGDILGEGAAGDGQGGAVLGAGIQGDGAAGDFCHGIGILMGQDTGNLAIGDGYLAAGHGNQAVAAGSLHGAAADVDDTAVLGIRRAVVVAVVGGLNLAAGDVDDRAILCHHSGGAVIDNLAALDVDGGGCAGGADGNAGAACGFHHALQHVDGAAIFCEGQVISRALSNQCCAADVDDTAVSPQDGAGAVHGQVLTQGQLAAVVYCEHIGDAGGDGHVFVRLDGQSLAGDHNGLIQSGILQDLDHIVCSSRIHRLGQGLKLLVVHLGNIVGRTDTVGAIGIGLGQEVLSTPCLFDGHSEGAAGDVQVILDLLGNLDAAADGAGGIHVHHGSCVAGVLVNVEGHAILGIDIGVSGDIHNTGVIGQGVQGIFVSGQSHVLQGQVCVVHDQDLGNLALLVQFIVGGQSTVLQGDGVARQDLQAQSFGALGAHCGVDGVGMAAKVNGDGLIDLHAGAGCVLRQGHGFAILGSGNGLGQGLEASLADLGHSDLLCALVRIVIAVAAGTGIGGVAVGIEGGLGIHAGIIAVRAIDIDAVQLLIDGVVTVDAVAGHIPVKAAAGDTQAAALHIEAAAILAAGDVHAAAGDLHGSGHLGIGNRHGGNLIFTVLAGIEGHLALRCGDGGILDGHITAVDGQAVEDVLVSGEGHLVQGQICVVHNQNLGYLTLLVQFIVGGQGTVLQGDGVACLDLQTQSLGTGGAHCGVDGVGEAGKVKGDGLVNHGTRAGIVAQ